MSWWFASSPVNLGCIEAINATGLLGPLTTLHETIFKQRDDVPQCGTVGWNNVILVNNSSATGYYGCNNNLKVSKPSTTSECDLGCQKSVFRLNNGKQVAASPLDWDSKCTNSMEPIYTNPVRSVPGTFNNISLFAHEPNHFFEIRKYNANSSCDPSALQEIHMFPFYSTCTPFKNHYVISSQVEDDLLQQFVCSDSDCQSCISGPVLASSPTCNEIDGSLFKSYGKYSSRAGNIGVSTSHDNHPATSNTSIVFIALGSLSLAAILISAIFLLIFRKRKREKDLEYEYSKSSIINHLQRKRDPKVEASMKTLERIPTDSDASTLNRLSAGELENPFRIRPPTLPYYTCQPLEIEFK